MKNPFGITEKKCKKSDYGFFRDMIKNSLGNYVSQYFKFDFKHVRTSFQTTYKDVIILSKGKRRIGFYQIIPKNYRETASEPIPDRKIDAQVKATIRGLSSVAGID